MTNLVIKRDMDNKTPTQKIIAKWPNKRSLADDINAFLGTSLKPVAVIRWFNRNSIPSKYDAAIVDAATRRALSVSLVDLMNARSSHTDQVGNYHAKLQGHTPQNEGAAT
jgi:hypothetical protein